MARRKASPPAVDVAQGADDGTATTADVVEEVVVPAPSTEESIVYPPENVKAPGAESRSEALTKLVRGQAPAVDSEAATSPVTPRRSGNEVEWPDGKRKLFMALVLVSMFKANVDGKVRYAYKGDVLHATEDVIDRGVALGALGLDF